MIVSAMNGDDMLPAIHELFLTLQMYFKTAGTLGHRADDMSISTWLRVGYYKWYQN